MIGKIFFATAREDKSGVLNYKYVQDHIDRVEDFSFEESSIDMAIACEPRFIDGSGNVYEPFRQYFRKIDSSTTERLMVCVPTKKG